MADINHLGQGFPRPRPARTGLLTTIARAGKIGQFEVENCTSVAD